MYFYHGFVRQLILMIKGIQLLNQFTPIKTGRHEIAQKRCLKVELKYKTSKIKSTVVYKVVKYRRYTSNTYIYTNKNFEDITQATRTYIRTKIQRTIYKQNVHIYVQDSRGQYTINTDLYTNKNSEDHSQATRTYIRTRFQRTIHKQHVYTNKNSDDHSQATSTHIRTKILEDITQSTRIYEQKYRGQYTSNTYIRTRIQMTIHKQHAHIYVQRFQWTIHNQHGYTKKNSEDHSQATRTYIQIRIQRTIHKQHTHIYDY